MRSLAATYAALALVDRHIAQARQSIDHQTYRVHQWQDWGRDTKLCEELLCLMRQSLIAFLVHRDLIIDEIRQHHAWRWLKEDLAPPP